MAFSAGGDGGRRAPEHAIRTRRLRQPAIAEQSRFMSTRPRVTFDPLTVWFEMSSNAPGFNAKLGANRSTTSTCAEVCNRPLSLSLIAFQRKLLTTAPSVRTASLPVGARLGVGLGVQGLSVIGRDR